MRRRCIERHVDVVGKASRRRVPTSSTSAHHCVDSAGSDIDSRLHFAHFSRARTSIGARIARLRRAAIVNNLRTTLDDLEFPSRRSPSSAASPPSSTRPTRCARKRREALAQLDELAQAIFVEMFGDPDTNPKGWPLAPSVISSRYAAASRLPEGDTILRDTAVPASIRVIRLQRRQSIDEARSCFLTPCDAAAVARAILSTRATSIICDRRIDWQDRMRAHRLTWPQSH